MKNLILITITFLLTSCAYKISEPIQPLSIIESCKLDTTKIRFDGYYNTLDTLVVKDKRRSDYGKSNSQLYKTIHLKIFGKNKKQFISFDNTKDNSALTCEFYNKEFDRYKLYGIKCPKFTIKNDSIYSYDIDLITVSAGQRVPVGFNYRGFVKNRDTIIDWKIIPPYPKDLTKFVLEVNKDFFKPKTLYFVKTDAVKCLKIDEL